MSSFEDDFHKALAATSRRGPHAFVVFDGHTYRVKSKKTVVPDLSKMDRFDALIWINRNTKPSGVQKKYNPLAGLGEALKVTTR